MNVRFKKVTIHHFLSFDHAEVDLTDRGYCLVSGVNKNPKDSARSNGSGKSTIFNAISYALVGETLQGLKSNVANIAFGDGCYVALDFSVDGDEYSIRRSRDDAKYGTNLSITVDGVNKSGKGIRESQAIIDQLLPEMTSELLGSVIMIGQGMPMRFSANTPSGRKEVLEHLSQSDYMIQDIKNRISERSSELSKKLRAAEDGLLEASSQSGIYGSQLASAKDEHAAKFGSERDFDAKIAEAFSEMTAKKCAAEALTAQLSGLEKDRDAIGQALLDVSVERGDYAKRFQDEHAAAQRELLVKAADANERVNSLRREIAALESITDICPTCGQRIPGKVKPDTSGKRAELEEASKRLAEIRREEEEDNSSYKKITEELSGRYDSRIAELKAKQAAVSSDISARKAELAGCERAKAEAERSMAELKSAKEFYSRDKERLEAHIKSLELRLAELADRSSKLTAEKDSLSERLDITKKMLTIASRDFRGFLLSSIIDYISIKAKEYAGKIFGCDDIGFALAGNDIDISFCGKDYENLSGGEKQRVDLIVQFAIRSFMCQYAQFSSNVLVLDEITDALDAESCEKVIGFITDELSDIESVFIISHHADELSIPVDSEIVVEKSAEGISSIR